MSRREKRILAAFGLFLSAAALVGALSGTLIRFASGRLQPGLVIAGLAVLLVAAVAASIPWWRRLDHMQRDMHLVSWYWGASFCGGLALLSALAIGGPKSELVAGALLVWVAQCVGYLVVRIMWRVSHRSEPA